MKETPEAIFCLSSANPHIRYVNNYQVNYAYRERPRILYDFELMYIAEGSAVMHYNGQRYDLEKNDIFYMKPHIENHITVEAGSGFRTHCIHFDWTRPAPEDDFTVEEFYLRSVLLPDHEERNRRLLHRARPCPQDFHIPVHCKTDPLLDFSGLFARCYYYYLNPGPANELYLKSAFYEIIALLHTHYSTHAASRMIHPRIQKALEYVSENYAEKLSVPGLAASFQLSPKYFGVLFKDAAGKSLNHYIRDLRIHRAMEMLAESNLTIEQIANTVGFENSFYFSNCFKKAEGLSPSEYRRLSRSHCPG